MWRLPWQPRILVMGTIAIVAFGAFLGITNPSRKATIPVQTTTTSTTWRPEPGYPTDDSQCTVTRNPTGHWTISHCIVHDDHLTDKHGRHYVLAPVPPTTIYGGI